MLESWHYGDVANTIAPLENEIYGLYQQNKTPAVAYLWGFNDETNYCLNKE